MAHKLITAPTVEPVDLTRAKLHLRVDDTADDSLIAGYLAAARELIEDWCSRALINQTWDLFLDEFPEGESIELPRAPLVSVTGVYYTPDDGAEQTFAAANYVVDTKNEPGKIVLEADASWPGDTLEPVNGVRVRFVCGYGTTGTSVPTPLRQAILLLTGHWYENREQVSVARPLYELPMGVQALIASYKGWRL